MVQTADLDGSEHRSWRACILGATQTDRRNNRRFMIWCVLWALAFVGAGIAQRQLELDGVVAWIVAFVPALPAIGALAAYLRFLREADEMVRAIHLQALAWGFGAGVVVVIGVQLPEYPGAPALRASDVLLAMMTTWMIAQFVAVWRMR